MELCGGADDAGELLLSAHHNRFTGGVSNSADLRPKLRVDRTNDRGVSSISIKKSQWFIGNQSTAVMISENCDCRVYSREMRDDGYLFRIWVLMQGKVYHLQPEACLCSSGNICTCDSFIAFLFIGDSRY